ncbi:TPA: DUF3693 domain-containing protein [Photobacterium damselae]
MYANYLLNTYKKAKNYVQDKQIAHDLNIDKSRITEMRKGKRYISDKEAIFLAENANIDPREALLGCHADRQEDPRIKQLWTDIAKKLNSHYFQSHSVVFLGILATLGDQITSTTKCALCILC